MAAEILPPRDAAIVRDIVARAAKLHRQVGIVFNAEQAAEAIAFVHLHLVPLRLAPMLAGSDRDLMFDVIGMCRHVERQPPRLLRGFVPRFAGVRPMKAAA